MRSACYEIVSPIGERTGGLLLGDEHKLKLAPDIGQHEDQGKEARTNRWAARKATGAACRDPRNRPQKAAKTRARQVRFSQYGLAGNSPDLTISDLSRFVLPLSRFVLPDLTISDLSRFVLPNTSTPIPWEEALEAQGRADMIEAVEKQDQLERYLDTVFGA